MTTQWIKIKTSTNHMAEHTEQIRQQIACERLGAGCTVASNPMNGTIDVIVLDKHFVRVVNVLDIHHWFNI